jgi:cytochrome P450/nitrite reductase/ring-hydroxylating ferredoxin subunit
VVSAKRFGVGEGLDGQGEGQGWVRVANVDELPGEGPYAVAAAGVDLVLLRSRSGLRVYEGRCPHQGALLGEGEIDGQSLVCRNHRWRFDGETGRRIGGGNECLRACPVKEVAREVFVDVGALKRPSPTASRPLRTLESLPGPKGLPLLGSALALPPTRMHLVLERWAERYGPLFLVRIGSHKVLIVADADLAQPLFRERPEIYRRPSHLEKVFDEMMVAGVFSAEGEAWRAQRRLAMQALSQRYLRGFYPTLEQVAIRLRDRWMEAAASGRVLDVAEELKRFTVDVTSRLVFGHDVNTLGKKDDDVLQRQLEHVFPALGRRLYAVFPYWRYLRLPADRRLDRATRQVYDWLGKIIEEARATLAADPQRAEEPANFIEAMLTARDLEGRPFPDSVIFGNALTMLLAGEDTTAYTLAWAVHHLCDSPEASAALGKEVDGVLGEALVPVDLEQANRLSYAMAVANETMRLRPVAPMFLFEANRDVIVGDVAVPKQTGISVLARTQTLDPARFDSPRSFAPQRWIEAGSGGRAHDAAVHVPFGSGPRICPGRALALLEMRVVLATLFRSFELERVGSSADVHELLAFTMAPVGLRVRLRRRTT